MISEENIFEMPDYESNLQDPNPNDIRVEISDAAPIVVLFGPSGIGKTMALVRLVRWLKKQGYSVYPDFKFRPSSDEHYRIICEYFEEMIHSDQCAMRTSEMGFMLVKVENKYGDPICQILDAPGEHFFGNNFENYRDFPLYVQEIFHSRNQKKIWMFFVNIDWPNEADISWPIPAPYPRKEQCYTVLVSGMKHLMNTRDQVIFTCTKVDRHPELYINGIPSAKAFFNEIEHLYYRIFDDYKNQNPLTKWFRPYNFDFVTFSSGIFQEARDGSVYYIQGKDYYPATLWKAIMKAVRY